MYMRSKAYLMSGNGKAAAERSMTCSAQPY
jgi:hypothetical protein